MAFLRAYIETFEAAFLVTRTIRVTAAVVVTLTGRHVTCTVALEQITIRELSSALNTRAGLRERT
jgi:hypothetical protein